MYGASRDGRVYLSAIETPVGNLPKNEIQRQHSDHKRKDYRAIHRAQTTIVASDKNCGSDGDDDRNKVDQ